MSEVPFKIAIPDDRLDLLRKKLTLATFPDEHEDAPRGQAYTAPLADIQRLAAYWKDGFDWRKAEARLNAALPQFTRDIDVEGFGTFNIHYVHQKSGLEEAIPLLFVHGWPGHFMEVLNILPLLLETSPDHPSFHVVALSLPGFGFSTGPTKTGFTPAKYAEVAHKLMLALGYNEYVVQGGDWGHVISRKMARYYGGKHVKAWHTNFQVAPQPTLFTKPLAYLTHLLGWYTPREKQGLERTNFYFKSLSEYFVVQASRPQTLGYGLADSPVGLLGWYYEKLLVCGDDYQWTDDEILTWLSIYWFSRAGITASMRIYWEAIREDPQVLYSTEPTTIPLGHSYFPRELIDLPRSWLKVPNLVFEAEHDRGGHFAAYATPELLVGDLRKMFGEGGPAYGVVSHHTGYAGGSKSKRG